MSQSNLFKMKISLFFVLLIFAVIAVAAVSAGSNQTLANEPTTMIVLSEKSEKLVDNGLNGVQLVDGQENATLASVSVKTNAMFDLGGISIKSKLPVGGGVTAMGVGWSD